MWKRRKIEWSKKWWRRNEKIRDFVPLFDGLGQLHFWERRGRWAPRATNPGYNFFQKQGPSVRIVKWRNRIYWVSTNNHFSVSMLVWLLRAPSRLGSTNECFLIFCGWKSVDKNVFGVPVVNFFPTEYLRLHYLGSRWKNVNLFFQFSLRWSL